MRTYDINTSGETVGTTPAGQTFQPLRYTTTKVDEIRVGVWLQLKTILGAYAFNTETDGLDVEAILDPATSDAERSALVADAVLRYPGVLGFLDGPTVTVEDGSTVAIEFTAETAEGSFDVLVTS